MIPVAPFQPPPRWPEVWGTVIGTVCAVTAVTALLGALAVFGRAFVRAVGW